MSTPPIGRSESEFIAQLLLERDEAAEALQVQNVMVCTAETSCGIMWNEQEAEGWGWWHSLPDTIVCQYPDHAFIK